MRHKQPDDVPKVDKSGIGYIPPHLVREFANALLSSSRANDKTRWYTKVGLHGDGEDIVRFSAIFPMWMFPSTAYFVNQLVQKDSEVVDFSGGSHCAPSYDTIEYKRGHSISALVDGEFNIVVDDIPMIISITSGGKAFANIWCNKSDNISIPQGIFNTLKDNISSLPFLKNEKLLMTSYNTIKFLKYPTLKRDKLILPSKIWSALDRNLFFVAKNRKKMEENNLDWKRGILIWGEPGTGKTMFGKLLCNEINDMTILWVTPRCIDDETDVSKLFEMARNLSPTIVFMEDLDFFATSRELQGPSYILGELLSQLDGLSPNDGIFVIGTTNKPGILDKAIGSRPARFDVKLKFDLPNTEGREKMYKLFLRDKENIDYRNLANRSDKLTGSHIRETVVRGVLATLHRPNTDLEEAIIEGIKELRDEELIAKPPGSLVT